MGMCNDKDLKVNKQFLSGKIGISIFIMMASFLIACNEITPVITASTVAGKAPVKGIIFDASKSKDNQKAARTYEWDFGDGSNHEYTETTKPHDFNEPGIYKVKLNIKSKDNKIYTSTCSIEVYNNQFDNKYGYLTTNFNIENGSNKTLTKLDLNNNNEILKQLNFYNEYSYISNLIVSNNGRQIFIITAEENEQSIYVINTNNFNERKQLYTINSTRSYDNFLSNLIISKDNNQLFFIEEVNSERNIVKIDLTTFKIFKSESNAECIALGKDGNRLYAYTSGKISTFYASTLEEITSESIPLNFNINFNITKMLITKNNKIYMLSDMESLYEINLQSKKISKLAYIYNYTYEIELSPYDGRLYLLADVYETDNASKRVIQIIDTADNSLYSEFNPYFPTKGDYHNFSVDLDGKYIYVFYEKAIRIYDIAKRGFLNNVINNEDLYDYYHDTLVVGNVPNIISGKFVKKFTGYFTYDIGIELTGTTSDGSLITQKEIIDSDSYSLIVPDGKYKIRPFSNYDGISFSPDNFKDINMSGQSISLDDISVFYNNYKVSGHISTDGKKRINICLIGTSKSTGLPVKKEASTDYNGNYSFDVVDGDYMIISSDSQYSFQPQIVNVNKQDVSVSDITQTYESKNIISGGYSQGEFKVDSRGGANYTIPIVTPHGINGMEPNLSINYNSQSPEGILGQGFSLSGISMIERGPSSKMRDGYTHPIDLTRNDRLYLDGEPLVCINGSYLMDGSYYRTARDSFRKIKYNKKTNNIGYFEVWGRDGTYYIYGGQSTTVITSDDSYEIAWGMSKAQDRYNNTMLIYYTPSNNILEPYKIQYGVKSGDELFYEIDFSYDTNYGRTSYVAGIEMMQDEHLEKIEVRAGNSVVRKYEFEYEPRTEPTKLRLKSIQECNGNGECYPPFILDWSTKEEGMEKASWSVPIYPTRIPIISNYVNYFGGFLIGDFNGDSICDLFKNDSGDWYFYPSNGKGFDSKIPASGVDYSIYEYIPFLRGVSTSVLDFNADRIEDLITIWPQNSHGPNGEEPGDIFAARSNAPFNYSSSKMTALNINTNKDKYSFGDDNGDNKTDIYKYYTSTESSNKWHNVVVGDGFSAQRTVVHFVDNRELTNDDMLTGDFNGDKLTDVLLIQDLNSCVYLNPGTSIEYKYGWYGDVKNLYNYEYKTNHKWDSPFTVVDINNDGLSDLIEIDGTGYAYAYLSTGKGFTNGSIYARDLAVGTGVQHVFGDINGNGWIDIIEATNIFQNSYDINVIYSYGNESWNVIHPKKYIGTFTWSSDIFVTSCSIAAIRDFNGDGINDLFFQNGDIWISKGPNPDLLTGITSSSGIKIDINYSPLTSKNCYQHEDTSIGESIIPYQAPIQVVSLYSVTNGTKDSSNPLENTNYYGYKYKGLKVDKIDRQMLGFREIQQYDWSTHILTIEEYNQKYPFTGMLKSKKMMLENSLIYQLTNTNKAQQYNNGVYLGTDQDLNEDYSYESIFNKQYSFYPYTESAVEDQFYLTGSSVRKTIYKKTLGNYGNLLKEEKTISNSEDIQKITTEYNNILNLEDDWILGLPSEVVTSTSYNGCAPEIRTTAYTYYETGKIREVIVEPNVGDRVNINTEYQYDDYGNILRHIDTGYNGYSFENRVTEYEIINEGIYKIVNETGPQGHKITKVYNSIGMLISETDSNHLTKGYLYDGFGRRIFERNPDGNCSKWIYKPVNTSITVGPDSVYSTYSLTTEIPGQPSSVTYFDMLGRAIKVESIGFNNAPIYKRTAYDRFGNTILKTEFASNVGSEQAVSYKYDLLNRPYSIKSYDKGETKIDYDLEGGTVIRSTDSKDHIRENKINVLGKDSEVREKNGIETYITKYEYYPFGDLKKVIDNAGNTTQMHYDERGRKTSMDDPDMGHYDYEYNAFGEIVTQTDPQNNRIQMKYDKAGRILSKSSGSLSYTYKYDIATNGIGAIAQVAGPEGYQENYFYDDLSRCNEIKTTVNGEPFTLTKTFDTLGRIDTLYYPATGDGSRLGIKYKYDDNLGYLKAINNIDNPNYYYWQVTGLNIKGQLTNWNLSNGAMSEANTFDDARGYLSGISCHKNDNNSNILQYTYGYDSVGNLSSREDNLKGLIETFEYDDLNRLWVVKLNGNITKTYNYDSLGNFITKGSVTGYQYDPQKPHAVVSAGGNTYHYDVLGNMDHDSTGRVFEFNTFNRPSLIKKGDVSAKFTYDASEMILTQKLTQGSKTTNTTYIGGIFEKISTTGVPNEYRHYINAGGEIFAVYTKKDNLSPSINYLHKDHLGSVSVITDESGNIISNGLMSFDPFGMRRNPLNWQDGTVAVSNITEKGYTGHLQLDLLGLVHMKGRIYDPNIGRFISPDPHVQDIYNPQSLNRFSYCLNNPLSLVDPSGYFSLKKFFQSIGVGVAGFVGFIIGNQIGGPGVGAIFAGMFAGAMSGYFNGGLKGAFIGMVTGGIIGGLGGAATTVGLGLLMVGAGAGLTLITEGEDGLIYYGGSLLSGLAAYGIYSYIKTAYTPVPSAPSNSEDLVDSSGFDNQNTFKIKKAGLLMDEWKQRTAKMNKMKSGHWTLSKNGFADTGGNGHWAYANHHAFPSFDLLNFDVHFFGNKPYGECYIDIQALGCLGYYTVYSMSGQSLGSGAVLNPNFGLSTDIGGLLPTRIYLCPLLDKSPGMLLENWNRMYVPSGI